MDVFVEQFPLTLRTTGLYAETFRRTVPGQSYDSPEATLETYLAALNGVLATFEETGTTDNFPRLLRDLTVLVEMLSEKS